MLRCDSNSKSLCLVCPITKCFYFSLNQQANGDYILSVYDLTLAIIRSANRNEFYRNNQFFAYIIVYSFVYLNLSIPFVKFIWQRNTIHVDSVFWISCFFISSTIVNFFFGAIVYFLLYVAIVDVIRQFTMVSQLHCMLRLTDLMMHAELSLGVAGVTDKCERECCEMCCVNLQESKFVCYFVRQLVAWFVTRPA